MRSIIPVLCLLALLTGAFFVVERLREQPQYTLQDGGRAVADSIFASEIRSLGGAQAYDRLARALQGLPVGDQHVYAHAFGHQLYEIEGSPGIAVCDRQFGMGCLHQILAEVVSDKGMEAIATLNAECTRLMESENVCVHGLGHGIVSSTGYGIDDLQQSLELCSEVSAERKYSGCEGGVFMEYNMRTIANVEGILDDRVPDQDALYAPCDAVANEYRKICLFWQPQWWFFDVLKAGKNSDDTRALFKQAGELCASSEYPQSCYEGLGYLAPSIFENNPESIRGACDSLGYARGARVYCRGTAAIIARLTSDTKERTTIMCDDLAGRELETCLMYAQTESDYSFSVAEHL